MSRGRSPVFQAASAIPPPSRHCSLTSILTQPLVSSEQTDVELFKGTTLSGTLTCNWGGRSVALQKHRMSDLPGFVP